MDEVENKEEKYENGGHDNQVVMGESKTEDITKF